MRRAIAGAIISGLVLGGAIAAPAWAQQGGAAPAAAAKTVVYAGYELRVPASWPVHGMDANPSTCVRYDVHAVYLGTPGADQQCPAGLLGRTETVSIIPSAVVAAGAGQEITQQSAQPFQAGATAVAALPAVGGAVMQNAEQHQLRVTLNAAGRPSATVIATYGASPVAVEQVLASLRAAGALPQAAAAAGQGTQAQSITSSWHGLPAGRPAQVIVPPAPPDPPASRPSPLHPSPPRHSSRSRHSPRTRHASRTRHAPPPPHPAVPVFGFDTCTAPSLATMRAWRVAYAAVGIYVGGVNAACGYGNLSASWIRAAAAMGWGMIPTYVGPQAPCSGIGVTINPALAAAQGKAAGDDAVGDAQLLGLPAGSPIYYDMEAYDNLLRSCSGAVLTFLGAWDHEVNVRGYVTGVYSSQDSGIVDLEAAAVGRRPGFTVPNAIWIAHWDNLATLADGNLVWPLTKRNKQYQGPHNRTVGGITLNIDGDLAGGPLAR